jgi:hypothetical protein
MVAVGYISTAVNIYVPSGFPRGSHLLDIQNDVRLNSSGLLSHPCAFSLAIFISNLSIFISHFNETPATLGQNPCRMETVRISRS